MNKDDFKKVFGDLAQKNGFVEVSGLWVREQEDSVVSLDLQHSDYSKTYYANIHVYIQGFFGKTFSISKDLKQETGNAAIFTRTPDEYSDSLNLENQMGDSERKDMLEKMFSDYIIPFVEKTSTREKIIKLHTTEGYFLLPAVKIELGLEVEGSEAKL